MKELVLQVVFPLVARQQEEYNIIKFSAALAISALNFTDPEVMVMILVSTDRPHIADAYRGRARQAC
jgi:hypothetical protein